MHIDPLNKMGVAVLDIELMIVILICDAQSLLHRLQVQVPVSAKLLLAYLVGLQRLLLLGVSVFDVLVRAIHDISAVLDWKLPRSRQVDSLRAGFVHFTLDIACTATRLSQLIVLLPIVQRLLALAFHFLGRNVLMLIFIGVKYLRQIRLRDVRPRS